MTTDDPAAPRTPSPPRRPKRARNLLLIVAGFVAMLGIIAGGTLFYFYDRATAIDRSTPEVVVVQFLDAAFVQRNPDRTSLFVCDDWSAADALASADVPGGESSSISWEAITSNTAGRSATVDVRAVFRVAVGNTYQRQVEAWRLQLLDEDGWRVCGLQVSS